MTPGLGKRFQRRIGLVLAATSLVLGAPVAAQFSKSYNFLKAVRDADGQKVTDALQNSASTLINTRDYNTGEGALHIVVKRRDSTYLAFLLAKGASPDIRDKDGNTPLMVAAQLGFTDGITQLIAARANVNASNNRGETALILAVQTHDAPTVRLLVSNGADPAQSDRIAGMSAKDYAAQDKRYTAIAKLLEDAKTQKPAAEVAGPKLGPK